MADEDQEKTSVFSVKTALGSASWSGKKMAEFITITLLVIMVLISYVLWEHERKTAKTSEQFVAAMKLVARSIDDSAVAQREFSCLIAKDQADRRTAFTSGECKRHAEFGRRRVNGDN